MPGQYVESVGGGGGRLAGGGGTFWCAYRVSITPSASLHITRARSGACARQSAASRLHSAIYLPIKMIWLRWLAGLHMQIMHTYVYVQCATCFALTPMISLPKNINTSILLYCRKAYGGLHTLQGAILLLPRCVIML